MLVAVPLITKSYAFTADVRVGVFKPDAKVITPVVSLNTTDTVAVTSPVKVAPAEFAIVRLLKATVLPTAPLTLITPAVFSVRDSGFDNPMMLESN